MPSYLLPPVNKSSNRFGIYTGTELRTNEEQTSPEKQHKDGETGKQKKKTIDVPRHHGS